MICHTYPSQSVFIYNENTQDPRAETFFYTGSEVWQGSTTAEEWAESHLLKSRINAAISETDRRIVLMRAAHERGHLPLRATA